MTLLILEAWKRADSVGHADVLLLQEVRQSNGNGEAVTAALSRQLGLSVAYAPADLLKNGHTQGLTIRFLGLPLRLDWLYLKNKNLEPLAWGVNRIQF